MSAPLAVPATPAFGEDATCVLPLPSAAFDRLPATFPVDGRVLARKREFHVTLVNRALSSRLLAQAGVDTARARLRTWIAALDWSCVRTGTCWLLADEGDTRHRRSVVERIEQPAQALLRLQLADWLGTPLSDPFPHVTLYADDGEGIGVFDTMAFERLAVRQVSLQPAPHA